MLTPTHLLAAQAAYLGGCVALGHSPVYGESCLALMAGIAPDLDHRQGLVGRQLPLLSAFLEHRFGHRTFTHALALQAAVLIPAFLFLPFGFALALAAGWLSHSFSDMMTDSGVCWFWPSRARCVLPGNSAFRMSSMSWGELAFAAGLALAGLGFMALSQINAGTAGLIRSAIGSIAAAREQYDAEKGTHEFRLRVAGKDNRGFEGIDGEFQVIGAWSESGFILQAGERFVTACKTGACDWYAERAVLVKGDPQITTTTTLQGKAVSVGALREALNGVQGAFAVYLIGEAGSDRIKAAPPLLEVQAGKVALHFLPAAALASWPETVLRDYSLTVQVRHAPGVTPPPVTLRDGAGPGLDPLLERWL